MKTKIVIIILGILFFLNESNAIENKILFKVNNKIITSIDIQNEMNYQQDEILERRHFCSLSLHTSK